MIDESTQITQYMKERDIHYLYHFTLSINLPYIFSDDNEINGLRSVEELGKKQGKIDFHNTDPNRYDGHREAICCTFSQPNGSYFNRSRENQLNKNDVYQDWAVLEVDASVVNETTLFSPTNAATQKGKLIKPGINGLRELFKDPVRYETVAGGPKCVYRGGRAKNLPTDLQAEVLVTKPIPVDKIRGIYFAKDRIAVEYYRLKLWMSEDILERLKFGTYSEIGISNPPRLVFENLDLGVTNG